MNGENPAATPTGDERVDDAVAALTGLTDLPVEDHPAALEQVHGRLAEILASLDEEQR